MTKTIYAAELRARVYGLDAGQALEAATEHLKRMDAAVISAETSRSGTMLLYAAAWLSKLIADLPNEIPLSVPNRSERLSLIRDDVGVWNLKGDDLASLHLDSRSGESMIAAFFQNVAETLDIDSVEGHAELRSMFRIPPQDLADTLAPLNNVPNHTQQAALALGSMLSVFTDPTMDAEVIHVFVGSLINSRMDIDEPAIAEGPNALHRLAAAGDLAGADALLFNGADPNALHIDWTPLMTAVNAGHAKIVDLLIENGARIDTGNSALLLNVAMHEFAINPVNASRMVKSLLDAGADPRAIDENGRNAEDAFRHVIETCREEIDSGSRAESYYDLADLEDRFEHFVSMTTAPTP